VNSSSIYLSWGPDSGVNSFNVRYGPSNGNWLFNTDVTGFSTTIGSLPSGQPIWIQVAARNECQIGEYGTAKFLGTSSNVPGFPDTGGQGNVNSPRFPSTGFGPHEDYRWIFYCVTPLLFLLLFYAYKQRD